MPTPEARHQALIHFSMDHAPFAIFWARKDAKIIHVNQSASDQLGYSKEELLNLHVYDFVPDLSVDKWPQRWEFLVRQKGASTVLRFESRHRRKDGTVYPVEIHFSVVDADGESIICAHAQDISERRRTRAEIERRQNLLETAEEVAKAGCWEFDLQVGLIMPSKGLLKIFGIPAGNFDGRWETFLSCVHPDDRNRVVDQYQQGIAHGALNPIDFRIRHPDGFEIPAVSYGRLIFDEEGKPQRLVGVVQDITERKAAQEALVDKLQFEALVSRISTSLVRHALGELSRGLEGALSEVGRFLLVDRASLIQISDDRTSQTCLYEWHGPGAAPIPRESPFFNAPAYGRLLQGDPVMISRCQELLPYDEDIYHGAVARGVKSFLWVPWSLHPSVRGYLCLENLNEERMWTPSAINRLKLVTPLLASALARGREEETRARLMEIIENATDFIGMADRTGRVLYLNPAGRRMMGLEPGDDISKRSIPDFHTADETARILKEGLPAALEMGAWQTETRFRSPVTQQEFVASQVLIAHRAAGGEVKFISTIVRDISAQQARYQKSRDQNTELEGRVAERTRALAESEARYRVLFESTKAGVFLMESSVDGVVIDANPAAIRYFGGQSREEVVGKKQLTFMPALAPDGGDIRAHFQKIRERIATEHSPSTELELRKVDGTPFFVEVISTLIDVGGRKTVLSIFHDVTERVEATRKLVTDREALDLRVRERTADLEKANIALRESEANFRQLVESQTEMIVRSLPDGTRIFVNEAYCRSFGLTREQCLGSTFYTQVPEEHREAIRQRFAGLSPVRPVAADEHPVLYPGGVIGWQAWSNRGFFDSEGRLTEIQAVGRDVTKRKLAEEELKESEARYRILVENAPEAIVMCDTDKGLFVEVNPNAEQLFKMTREALFKVGPLDVSPPIQPDGRPSSEGAQSYIGEALNGGNPLFEWVHRDALGGLITCEIRLSRLPSQGRSLIRGSIVDITQKKLLEQSIRDLIAGGASLGQKFFDQIAVQLGRHLGADYVLIGEFVKEQTAVRTLSLCAGPDILSNLEFAVAGTPFAQMHGKDFCVFSREAALLFPGDPLLRNLAVEGYVGVPLFDARNEPLGVISVLYKKPIDNLSFAETIMKLFAARVGAEVDRKRAQELLEETHRRLQKAHEETNELKDRLLAENTYLQAEIKVQHNFEEIVSQSEVLKKVLQKIEQVASTDASVLITGETGTGKELLARAIHNLSPRQGRPLVKVNCGSLPPSLIESELFGHEKGAFTGALNQRAGRFELADGGTLFLDEIGELPFAVQAQLLRVLQDGEFERVGGQKTLKVNVRVIAATNRDLQREVEKKAFRQDLYFRLNVFPVHNPPLRERLEDIPILVRHFVHKFAQRLGKEITQIPESLIRDLRAYDWPGNVRELENIVERGVILSPGPKLILAEWKPERPALESAWEAKTMEEAERKHILGVLEARLWRVSGDKGAAKVLGMKPTTLEARMKKLGIVRPV